MPWRASAKASEKIPALAASLRMGVVATVHLFPRSLVWNTRAASTPPVPNHASLLPRTTRHVPLAANNPSFGTASGVCFLRQFSPPSDVVYTVGRPSTASPTIMPLRRSQKASASKNPLASGFVNRSFHVAPPSSVRYTRDWPPLPILNSRTVFASTMWRSRKSSCSAPGTLADSHVAPPSEVCTKVPPLPLAQTTFSLRAPRPRSEASVPLWCIIQL